MIDLDHFSLGNERKLHRYNKIRQIVVFMVEINFQSVMFITPFELAKTWKPMRSGYVSKFAISLAFGIFVKLV